VPTDVSDYDQVARAARSIDRALQGIDVWVNNAMTTIFAPLWDVAPAEYDRATRVTYLGTVWGTQVALEHMRRRDRGTIVQVGSALAYRSIPLQAPYCGAKSAVRGFTDSLRSELIHEGSGIELTMVQLPGLNTPQFEWCETRLSHHPRPVPPVYQPEVAADAIVWAAEHPQREVWVAGSTWQAIVGQKLIPQLLDRLLAKKAWEGQETDDPVAPGRPSNLFAPVPGDHGAHGAFDDDARATSPLMALSKRRRLLGGAALVAAGALAAGYLLRE
jgi:NAD(P)-dependent dehydrogenase (short-subunit alcohol dehydrogenase family)